MRQIECLLCVYSKNNLYKYQMLVKQANSFKAIDDLLQKSKDLTVITQLYEKKQRMLEMVESGKLTGDKYLLICKKIVAESTIQQIKDSTDMQMIDLDDNVSAWFKNVINETKDKMEDQKKIIIKSGGKVQQKPKSNAKPQQKKPIQNTTQPKIQKKPSTKQTQSQASKQPVQQMNKSMAKSTLAESSIDPTKIYSLKVLDSLMEDNPGDKKLYMSLFQQKERLLKIIADKKLNAQSYFQTLQKSFKTSNNEDMSLSMQMELDELKDFHSGDVQAWFKDRLQSTQQQKQRQQQKYSIFKTGKAATIKRQKDDIDPDVESITATVSQKIKRQKLPSGSYLMSLRYLDQQMQKYEQEKTKYCQLFQQKVKLIDKFKNREIDGQIYRDMLGQLSQESPDQQLKQAAQAQIDLHDLTGDIDQFFQSAINESGQKLQSQQKIYNDFTGGKSQKFKPKKNSISTKQIQIQIPKQIKPDIADIVSFTVLVEFLQKYKTDYDYTVQLKQKGTKLMKLVEQKKLGANQYIKFLQAKILSAKDKETIVLMNKQLQRFKQSKDVNKQFKIVVGDYLNKVKVNLGNRGTYDGSQIQINYITIDSADNKTKILFLLRKLSKYESLLAYYKNNKLERHAKQFDPQYQTAKKKTLVLCEKLKNNEPLTDEIHNFIDENLPPISFGVLHRQSRASYNEKLNIVIDKINKSNAKITEYVKALKKGSNKSNIQQGGKMIEKNNKMISYLQSLKNEDFIPLPLVEQAKVEMFNLDLNKNLTENEIQIIIRNFQGIRDPINFQIFMIDKKSPRFQAKVSDGPQNKIDVIIKIPPEIMQEIIKGTDKRYLNFKLVSKGFFSDKVVADADLQLNFIRSNRMEDRMVLKQQKIFMDYTINVQKPKKPLVTEIPTIKLTQYPKYEDNKFIQKEFIKTVMPFQKPTQSEMIAA